MVANLHLRDYVRLNMEYNIRTFNSHDIERIRGFLDLATDSKKGERYKSLVRLKNDLAYADIVLPEEMPGNVVTMNSRIRIDNASSKGTEEITLVFPQEADYNQGKVSLLAPLGAALLGCRQGDTVTYIAPGGEVMVKIMEILYQPEANGDFTA
ncbi:GreA/GreB family elongation factor [Marispirochaeta aestuarii]|uniref:GreA/GreB family elongation factor n=1 Tax=Marispirochaeta aestuarii TaxID=1963862 RepID=UPI0029C7C3A0|nr:GreA/GreB family elongation factor [Marispirochaeta aestuarii]